MSTMIDSKENAMNIYDQYAIACAHLLGIISVSKVIEICRDQNPELPVGEVKLHHTVLEKAKVRLHDGFVVHRAILFSGDFPTFRRNAEQIPIYIPQKEELLRYLDELYFEKNEAYWRLEAFLKKRHPSNASAIADQIRLDLFYGEDFDRVFENAERMGLIVTTEKSMREFVKLVVDMANNMRTWENNGFTAVERRDLTEKSADTGGAAAVHEELAAFLREHGRSHFLVPAKTRPYRALIKRQADTAFDEATMLAVDALGEKLDAAGLFSLTNAYNLIHICPFCYRTITACLMQSEPSNQEDLLRLSIAAYEKAHPNELILPSEDFYDRNDNFHYILALDNLGTLLKSKGNLREAIDVYKKALTLDLGDRKHIGEAILFCYFASGQYAEFDEALRKLPEDSLYRIFLDLIFSIMLDQPSESAYANALRKSPLLMAALTGQEKRFLDMATETERFFYYDFYPVVDAYSKLKTTIKKLRSGIPRQTPFV